MKNRLCEMFGIEFPIFAFSHCRDVVAAVSRAGGMGVLGALAFTPEQLDLELAWIDEHVDGRPYGVDVVIPARSADRDAGIDSEDGIAERLHDMVPAGHRAFLEQFLADHDLPPLPEDAHRPEGLVGKGVLNWTAATGTPIIDVALAHPIKLLVSALGPPPPHVVERCREQDIRTAALVGTVAHAVRDAQQGIDVLIAQSSEAGGHTGDVGSMVLIPDVIDAIGPDIPVLAAGGIGTGRQMAAAMALGAAGVWTGSIWLTVAEADTNPILVEKLLDAQTGDTVRSKAQSGKLNRQLRTAWTEAMDDPTGPGPLPMPLQFLLYSEVNRRAQYWGRKELVASSVGQIVSRMDRVRSSREVVLDMVTGYLEVVDRLGAEELGAD